MPPLTVSTRTLSEKSGLTVQQVQALTGAGAFIPDQGAEAPGRGGSRQYPFAELDVAMLMAPITHKGMSGREARGIATTLRGIVLAPEHLGFNGLEQARELARHINWRIVTSHVRPHRPGPEIVQFAPSSGASATAEPWDHVEPTQSNLLAIQAWIALELAKHGLADPTLFLHHAPDDTWRYEVWATVPIADGPRSYQFGNASINISPVDRKSASADQYESQIDEILIELTAPNSKYRGRRRGGYVLMPRSVYDPDYRD